MLKAAINSVCGNRIGSQHRTRTKCSDGACVTPPPPPPPPPPPLPHSQTQYNCFLQICDLNFINPESFFFSVQLVDPYWITFWISFDFIKEKLTNLW